MIACRGDWMGWVTATGLRNLLGILWSLGWAFLLSCVTSHLDSDSIQYLLDERMMDIDEYQSEKLLFLR